MTHACPVLQGVKPSNAAAHGTIVNMKGKGNPGKRSVPHCCHIATCVFVWLGLGNAQVVCLCLVVR